MKIRFEVKVTNAEYGRVFHKDFKINSVKDATKAVAEIGPMLEKLIARFIP